MVNKSMATKHIVLDDDKKFALMKFRRSVSDVLEPHHNDYFLLRWLRARSWNPVAAEQMLRQSLRWRKQWEVDTALKTWEIPEPLKLCYPSGICGYDKDGAPVVVVPFSGFDVVGVLHSVSRQDTIRLVIKLLEEYLDAAIKSGAMQLVVIFDMEHFVLRPYTWRPATEVVISLIKMYEANYPEILKAAYLINAPRIFAVAFNVVKRFLNEYTIGKIQIYKSDPKKWQAALLENIDPDNLPKYLGGNLVDPDGNPRYTTKIRQGGKVPKSYYTKNLDEGVENEKKLTSTVIKKGDKLVLTFKVEEEGCFLRWLFRTEDHDIRFGITVQDKNGNINTAETLRRIAAHQIEEAGVLPCQTACTYTVTFDNTYSIMRAKKLHYNVEVTPSLEKITIQPNEGNIEETGTNGTNSIACVSKTELTPIQA